MQREKAQHHILKDWASWPDTKKAGLTHLSSSCLLNSLQTPSPLLGKQRGCWEGAQAEFQLEPGRGPSAEWAQLG